jgi:hypothetical protein
MKIEGAFRNGYHIELDCDIRDYLDGKYKATLISPNEILVDMPAVQFAFIHDREERIKMMKKRGVFCEYSQGWMDVFRNKLLENKERNEKKVILRFPETIVLTTSVTYPKLTNGSMKADFVPYYKEVDIGKLKGVKITKCFIFWKVTIIEEEVRRYDKAIAGSKDELVDDLVDLFNGTNLW